MPLKLSSLREATLDILFPAGVSAAEGRVITSTPACLEYLPHLNAEVLIHLNPPLFIDAVHSPFRFEGTIRRAIHELKYTHLRDVSGTLAVLLNEYLKKRK